MSGMSSAPSEMLSITRERDREGPKNTFLYVQDPSSNEHRDYAEFHTDFSFHVGKQLWPLRVIENHFLRWVKIS